MVYSKISMKEHIYGFCGFSLNHKSFPGNHGLINWQYKSTKCYSESFAMNSHFALKTRKFSPWELYHIRYTAYK